MSKELENLNCGEEVKTKYGVCYAYSPDVIEEVKKSLHRLEEIDNADPSEALKCFERIDNTLCLNNIKGKLEFGIDDEEHIDCDSVISMVEDLETIKAALIKSQANTRSEEILQKYYQEGITLDSVRALKKEMAELKGQVPEPKKYLKWEDLEFTKDLKCQKVKMNNNDYRIRYTLDDFGGKCCFLYDSARNHYIVLNKQFFNDLHLEVIENE